MRNSAFVSAARPFLQVLQHHLTKQPSATSVASAMIQCSQALDKALADFENLALRLTGSQAMVNQGSFLLCTMSDELLMHRFDLSWTKLSLLAKHHANAHGGEMSWQQLEQMLVGSGRRRSTQELDMLQLYEFCIALGLRGRYRAMVDGDNRLHQLRIKLHKVIYGHAHNEAHMAQLVNLSMRHLQLQPHWSRLQLLMILLVAGLLIILFVDLSLSMRWSQVIRATLPSYGQTG